MGNLHCYVVEALRRVVSRTVGATKLCERSRSLVDGILSVRKTAPMAAVDKKNRHREGCMTH